MASYKLIQDVEADDKLLGPLSFRQFIYALVAVFLLYVSWLLYSHHAELLDIVILPIALFSGFLAYPFGKDQPTEVWALAKIRFLLKPRRRIWAQSGVKELVTITAPKKIEVQRTNGLSQTEVKSRLQALANTIDTRGWAIKNVNNIYQNPLTRLDDSSDRLVSVSALPLNVPDYEVPSSEDLFDEDTNPIAQQVDLLLNANTNQHRQELIEHLNAVKQKVPTTTIGPQAAPPPTTNNLPLEDDNEIKEELKTAYNTSHASLNNMHALRTKRPMPVAKAPAAEPSQTASTPPSDPVIINLSHRDDLNVNVISHEADRALADKDSGSDEVLISLH